MATKNVKVGSIWYSIEKTAPGEFDIKVKIKHPTAILTEDDIIELVRATRLYEETEESED